MNKRLLSLLLAAVMLLVLVPVEVFADTVPVQYQEYDGGSFVTGNCATYTSVTADTKAWNDAWYVVDTDVGITDRVNVTGDACLILMDGKSLTISGGIGVPAGASLTIYGQSGGTGRLTAQGSSSCAGIGGNNRESGGDITINGGTILATGGKFAAGIGGGDTAACGAVIIHGGTVTATGDTGGAGIGAGNNSACSTITVTAGMITATGKDGGAGIGGGWNGSYGSISISNAMVIAKAVSGGTEHIGKGNDNTESLSPVEKTDCITIEGSSDTGVVVGSPTLSGNVTIPAGKSITIPAGQTVTVASGAELTNNGTVTIASGAALTNNGTVTVASGAELTNSGTVTVVSGATLTNNGTVTVASDATLNNSGAMTVAPGATMTNNGMVQNDGAIQNNGTIAGTITGTPAQVPAPSAPSGPSQYYYPALSGAGDIWKPGTQNGYTASFSAPLADFTGLRLDGNPVPDGSFTAVSGSTVITLKPGYLATLPAGEHTLEALFTSGYGQAIFTVAEGKKANPETGGSTLETGDTIETGKIEFNAAAPQEEPVDSAPEAAHAVESANVLLPVLLAVLVLAAGTGCWLRKRKEN